MIHLGDLEAWFITGSQHLYGAETLKQVEEHATIIARTLTASPDIPVKIVLKPVLTGGEAIHKLCQEANSSKNCAALIVWMHTFSPARMWIAGLRSLDKPLLHLHTQFNQELPWSTIDMNFMNLNQSAHGDREFGFIGAACASGARSLPAFGKIPRFMQRPGHGYGLRAPGTMRDN